MKSLLALYAIVSVAAALASYDLGKHATFHGPPEHHRRALVERRQLIEESVINIRPWQIEGSFYMNVSVGTPAQLMTVNIFTATSATYFDAQNSTECQGYPPIDGLGDLLCAGGSFQANFSATYQVQVVDGFNLTYYYYSALATGDLATDIIQVGDVQLANMRFGVVYYNAVSTGVIGLGYGVDYETATVSPYGSFLEELQAAGVIQSKLYGLWLGSNNASTGSIVFGGMDLAHIGGDLVAIDFLPSTADTWVPTEIWNGQTPVDAVTMPMIALTNIGVTYSNGTNLTLYENGDPTGKANTSIPSILDSSLAYWALPAPVFDKLSPLIPGLNTSTLAVSCDLATNTDTNLTLTLANLVTINVPLSYLILPVFNPETRIQNTTAMGLPLCLFAAYPSTHSLIDPYFLGTSVMQAMYLVFDLDNAQVSVAQAVAPGSCSFSGCSDSYPIEIPAGPNGISQALASQQVSTVTVQTAASNTDFMAAIVTATGGSSGLSSPVARTVSSFIGTVVGTAAVPSGGEGIGQNIISSGVVGSGAGSARPTRGGSATAAGSSATTAGSSATASQKGGVGRLSRPVGGEWVVMTGLGCAAVLVVALAMGL
ncbi:hypothetical protein LTR91_018727 [Friedmanniomyces endolithicus]|uniref:Peptidase A1 domain-containing protein n=1 Tax=Friedmanniomyces endolithicus TaxID=329885 RepID=A0AAN6HCB3_9PEZI|nr:hypothetical protein LTR94_016033 [Friedmanniomyces endolithicus]KAK0777640.1 hypothetical protein LTR59_013796 [Friedmanniomyces endolithicus]KAK0782869.1 hypothetical protein LTR38_013231 [Friedmanniomyces endolithicus]KAK0788381.1 hypothetical protein LTR75_012613 [Friedmanniomyces endolithicus]KAK0836323.1 hypothetical protein LTR03_013790 [Friedmanniomyces endolithicus]